MPPKLATGRGGAGPAGSWAQRVRARRRRQRQPALPAAEDRGTRAQPGAGGLRLGVAAAGTEVATSRGSRGARAAGCLRWALFNLKNRPGQQNIAGKPGHHTRKLPSHLDRGTEAKLGTHDITASGRHHAHSRALRYLGQVLRMGALALPGGRLESISPAALARPGGRLDSISPAAL